MVLLLIVAKLNILVLVLLTLKSPVRWVLMITIISLILLRCSRLIEVAIVVSNIEAVAQELKLALLLELANCFLNTLAK